jgi:ParB family chromosome partitioning protein
MAKTARKKKPAAPMIVFSQARDIPLNRIRLSDDNVRKIDVEDGLDELAQDIERREDLIQSLNVRAILDADGNETGDYETPAGGRRYRSIARLVKAGRFPEDGLVPCIVKKADAKTSAVDDSLAENVQRLPLHPLDQFRAFQAMREAGQSEEEIAAAYFTTSHVVKQRLRLASVSPKLLDLYAKDELSLEQLMAFTITDDHKRQEKVWKAIANSYSDEPYQIRRMLTEKSVRASDRRAIFVGVDAYEAAGGMVIRDLFEQDGGGWLEDVSLLDELVSTKLKQEAEQIAGEGWKWIEVAVDFPYGHTDGLRGLIGEMVDLSDGERAAREALRVEQTRLEAEYAEADELPDEVDQRLGEIEEALESFEQRAVVYDPADIPVAGVFVSIDRSGRLHADRGYVRPDDEPSIAAAGSSAQDGNGGGATSSATRTVITIGGHSGDTEEDEDDALKPLPDRLMMELTVHRTLALRDALASHPEVALTALLHKLVTDIVHGAAANGACLDASVRRVSLSIQAADLKDAPCATAIDERQEAWRADLPQDDQALWDRLTDLDSASRLSLLAHCVSFGLNALHERPNPYAANGVSQQALEKRFRQVDRLSRAVGLDMAEAGWTPTVDNYFGRVPKRRILEAVREGRGERQAQLIDHLKKADMAKEAERLLADTCCLPEPLRLTDLDGEAEDAALPAFLADDGGDEDVLDGEEDERAMVAAE